MNRILKSTARVAVVMLGLLAWSPWSHAAAEATAPDYGLLDQVLLHNVRNGYVDYDGIRASPKFDRFLEQLAAVPPPFASPAGELAYYINAYNALAIRGVLEGFSPASRLGRWRYYKRQKFTVAGARLSLDDIERLRLRPLGDARHHFAIAGAALSGPRLANRAYLQDTLDAQLDAATRRFVNDFTRNRFDVAMKTAFLSPVFEEYGEDFVSAAGSVTGFLLPYIEDPAERAALREGRLTVRYLPFDWDLNGSLAVRARQ